MRGCCFHYSLDLVQIFFFGCVKLLGYIAFAAKVVSSNPCVGPSPRIKMSLFLLLKCTDELISAPKIMTSFPMPSSVNKTSQQESNPMTSSHICIYLD